MMNKNLIMIMILTVTTAGIAASPPGLVNYQGVLRNSSDEPLDGDHDMVFAFWSDATGGEEIMLDEHLVTGTGAVPATGGMFNVQLGSGNVVDGAGPGMYGSLSGLFRDYATVWLEVRIGGEVLTPRIRVVAAAYAMNADHLDGMSSSEFAGAVHGHSGGDIGGPVQEAVNAGTLDNLDSTQYLRSDTSDTVTAGTLTIGGSAKLDVVGTLNSSLMWDLDDAGNRYRVDPAGTSIFSQLQIDTESGLYLNHDGPDLSSYIYFYDSGTSTGEYLFWNDASDWFQFSDDVWIQGLGEADTFKARRFNDSDNSNYYLDPSGTSALSQLYLDNVSALYVNHDGPDSNSYIYFYDSASSTGEYLFWNDPSDWFQFSDDLWVGGELTASSFGDAQSSTYSIDPSGQSTFNTVRTAAQYTYFNYNGPEGDTGLYFYNSGSSTGESLFWDDSADRFAFSDDLSVPGDITDVNRIFLNSASALYMNYDGPDSSTYMYIYDGSSTTGEYLMWNDGSDRFQFSDDLYVSDASLGIEAVGSVAGAKFSDSNGTGYAFLGYNHEGISAHGTIQGGYFEDDNSTANAHVAYDTYKIQGTGGVSFIQNHPEDPGRVIVYTSPEGDETATYTRGTARLKEGEVTVALGETFKWVTNPDIGLTAFLTPHGEAVPLAVVSLTTEELTVRAPDGASPDLVFDYIVYGLRIGFEETTVVQEKTEEAYIPSMATHRSRFDQRPDLRRFNAFERFKTMMIDTSLLIDETAMDLSASRALRDAIIEYDPEIHGTGHDRFRDGAGADLAESDPSIPDAGKQDAGPGGDGDSTPVVLTGEIVDEEATGDPREQVGMTTLLPVSEPVETGDLLVLDLERPGRVRRSVFAGDRTVIGIAAGEVVEVDGRMHVPVAVNGIITLKVDATHGAVLPGDTLTTSPTPGHAMTSVMPLQGTVVAKAIEGLESGTGQVKAVVMLQ